jgi:putative transcriptional regulator
MWSTPTEAAPGGSFLRERQLLMKKQGTGPDTPGPDEQANHPHPDELSDLPDGQTDWEYLARMTGEQAHRNALADEDSYPMTSAQLARMRRAPNPRAIRDRLKMTQPEFARQFQVSVGTLRDWEQGLHLPDSAATAYLRVIEQIPAAVLWALRSSEPGRGVQAIVRVRPDLSLNEPATFVITGSLKATWRTEANTATLDIESTQEAAERAA